jgi:hypothetical protein
MRNKQARTRAQDLLSPFPSDAARMMSGALPLLSPLLKADAAPSVLHCRRNVSKFVTGLTEGHVCDLTFQKKIILRCFLRVLGTRQIKWGDAPPRHARRFAHLPQRCPSVSCTCAARPLRRRACVRARAVAWQRCGRSPRWALYAGAV